MNMALVIALLGLTMFAVAVLLLPLLWGRRQEATREAYNLAVYRDQIAEVERDIGRGVLTADQAEAARAEIGRRILALSGPSEGTAAAPAGSVMSAAAVVAILLVPIAAWAIYWQLGSPMVPDQPFAQRGQSTETPQRTAAAGATPHADMEEAVGKLAAQLKDKPDDLTGWLLLARTDISLARFQGAADAYQRAYELSGKRADIAGDWAEAQVMAAGGKVTPQAQEAFTAGLKDAEGAPRSRYYLALAQAQNGDLKGAIEAWRKLEADSPKDAEWLPMLRQRIAQAEGVQNGTQPAAMPEESPASAASASPAAPTASAGAGSPPSSAPPSNTPDPAAVAAAQKATANASPEQRQAMIRTMVDSLAARLASQPDDLEGWSRLGRSYMVLNEPQKARDAYAHAVKLKPDALPLKEAYAESMIDAAGQDATVPPADAVAVFREILQADPKNQEALWYIGIAEADAGNDTAARDLWTRLLAQLPDNAPEHKAVTDRLAALNAPTPPK